MELFSRRMGAGEPLIILHGLYGSSDNWYTIGKKLSEFFTVYLVDQRNHGQSPHSNEHNYELLSDDLYNYIQKNNLTDLIIIGHSMGGKTALSFGLKHQYLIKKMIIIDISPAGYDKELNTDINNNHLLILSALKNLDIRNLKSRKEADKQLEKTISSEKVRQFLLKNLKRVSDNKFEWSFNIEALYNNIDKIFASVLDGEKTNLEKEPQFPLLFIKGEYSNYIQKKDEDVIMNYFPQAKIEIIKNSGHWIHAEQPEAFLESVINFIK